MTKPIPEGYTTITPSLTLDNAGEAIELYKKAFGAKDLGIMKSPDGSDKIMHAVLEINGARLFLADNVCAGGEASKSSFYLYFNDADAAFKQAKEAGLSERFPVTDMFWGDRMGSVQDKFGISWTIATHVREVSETELKKGAEDFAKKMKSQAA